MVPNLNIAATKLDLILQEFSRPRHTPLGLPAPEVRSTPINKAARNNRIFSMAFLTLYPTGMADYNTPCLRHVNLPDYARHMLCYQDSRFGRHPRWRFLIFNLIMRRRASGSARFYVLKASGLKDLTREELATALLTDHTLLLQIVRQGSMLTGTRLF
jgi:hypothetical protein